MIKSGNVLGISFESFRVSNLEKSIHYYKALGFTVAGDAIFPWTKDEAENRLYNTPGAMSRTVKLTVASTASGEPFILYLREYKDLERGNRVDFPARHPSATHIGLIAPDADSLWAQMKSAGLLRALSWDAKLVRMPGQTSGGIAYVMDLPEVYITCPYRKLMRQLLGRIHSRQAAYSTYPSYPCYRQQGSLVGRRQL